MQVYVAIINRTSCILGHVFSSS